MQRKWRRSWKKRLLLPVAAVSILLASVNGVYANPTDGQITSGAGSIVQSGNTLTVTQNSNKMIVNWQSFNIASNETVNFVQPGTGAIALNRVVGNNASGIYGHLNANGQVFLINPNGVLFAPGAQVNVGGLVASTQNLTDSNFQAGKYKFSGSGGTVVNQGTITAAKGGCVALLGNQVSNQGVIVAQQETVALAAGNAATLDFNGDGLLNLAVNQSAVNALAENRNLIQADGGQVIMTARAADALAGTVVNNSGIIRARSVSNVNGIITLDGGSTGTVSVSGTLEASGKAAGQTGGAVSVLGSNITVDNATLNAAGEQGGGTILVGSNAHGQGPQRNATTTTIGPNVSLNADAVTSGNGGKVVIWSDGVTNFAGTITARGGSVAGNGGSIETSGKSTLKVTDTAKVITTAVSGKTGNWLLDPNDFTIGGSSSDMSVSTLETALANSDVIIATSISDSSASVNGSTIATGTTGSDGNINVNAPVAWGSTYTLTLLAYNNININAPITAASGRLNLAANTSGLGNGTTTGIISAPAAVKVGTFTLNGGTWCQVGSGMSGGVLPTFSVTDFRAGGGTFIRADDGAGTSASPYRIADIYGLQGIGSNGMLDKYYMLANNIDASGTSSWNSGTGFVPCGNIKIGFSGSFDGGSHTITGLTIDCPSTDYVGLFGYSVGSISNVGLIGGHITGSSRVGGLVGVNNGTITNSYSASTVSGVDNVGGLAGYNDGGILTDSYSTGVVQGSSYVGGLVGFSSGKITNSYSVGAVTGSSYVGGLAGDDIGTITNSYWDVNTSGQAHSGGSPDANGLTTAQMMGVASYNGWDLATIGGSSSGWRIYEGYTYPLLRSFLTPLTVTANDVSQIYDGMTYSGGAGVTYSIPLASLLGTVSYSGTSQGARNAGTYTITPAGLYSSQQGYDLTYVNGTLTISPKSTNSTDIAIANARLSTVTSVSKLAGTGLAVDTAVVVNSVSREATGTKIVTSDSGTVITAKTNAELATDSKDTPNKNSSSSDKAAEKSVSGGKDSAVAASSTRHEASPAELERNGGARERSSLPPPLAPMNVGALLPGYEPESSGTPNIKIREAAPIDKAPDFRQETVGRSQISASDNNDGVYNAQVYQATPYQPSSVPDDPYQPSSSEGNKQSEDTPSIFMTNYSSQEGAVDSAAKILLFLLP